MGSQVIEIPYEAREWALDFHDSDKRWKVLVLHRRAGKTTAAINHLQRDALTVPNSRYAYISPTYKMSKNVCWDIMKEYSRCVPGVTYNESELTVKYPNGSKITLYGADNPDSLRGIGLWGVVFDEYSQQPGNIFTEIIRPALADHKGYAIWIGTPKGKNEFYKLYKNADEDWYAKLLTAEDTGLIGKEELADAKKTMSEDEFLQEWFCSFEAAIKGAYYAAELQLMREQGRVKLLPHDKALKVHTVWDLGVGENLVCGMFQKSGEEVKLIDTWRGTRDEGVLDALAIISKKPYIFGSHFFPHDVQGREETTGKSRKEAIEALDYEVTVVPEIGVANGIEAVKRMFSRLWVDENQKEFLETIPQYKRQWDESRGMFRDDPYHDFASHYADMLRYCAVIEDQMTNEQPRSSVTYKPQFKGFNRRG